MKRKGRLLAVRVFDIEDNDTIREFKARYRKPGLTCRTFIRRVKADSAYIDVIIGVARRAPESEV